MRNQNMTPYYFNKNCFREGSVLGPDIYGKKLIYGQYYTDSRMSMRNSVSCLRMLSKKGAKS